MPLYFLNDLIITDSDKAKNRKADTIITNSDEAKTIDSKAILLLRIVLSKIGSLLLIVTLYILDSLMITNNKALFPR